MTRAKKRKPRKPKDIALVGYYGSYAHICILSARVRFQNCSGDVFYCVKIKDMRRISKFFAQAADYLEARGE